MMLIAPSAVICESELYKHLTTD